LSKHSFLLLCFILAQIIARPSHNYNQSEDLSNGVSLSDYLLDSQAAMPLRCNLVSSVFAPGDAARNIYLP
jgi:hypothetical protein